MGPHPAPYWFDQMRHTTETFICYSVEQGLIVTPLALEELFATELEG